ncbi:Zn(2)-C6 fungal-specific transcription factor [Mucor lusitanicus]|uniref:Zn(2)-C6 fungal-specific transcription factor n=2 Tax=Mucor circinelloides f. lusitanicus TaxID=29924 RepID=A0A168IWA8_MUCCL|nr:Zn(2)-C6 fungal-specific transcription factor [Mucor lusitanicus]OAD00438.1 Zn(2)-C6 fungal-specific transcription factor [Mucor lusitanicus CBS 277.49]
MSTKTTPCAECRLQRRKCSRPASDQECFRCKRLGIICKQPMKLTELNEIDTSQEMDDLQDQMLQLEEACHFMENQLDLYRKEKNSSNKQMTAISNNTMLQSLFQNWKVKIVNGGFQIETGIRDLTDLLMLNTSISYLSPLSYDSASSIHSDDSYYRGRDASIVLNFGKDSAGSLIPFTIRTMARSLTSKTSHIPVALLLPSILLLNPKSLVDQLLKIYFQCHNIYNPLVHENTYRDKMTTIQDPLTDLLTLSICSYVCSTPCQHLTFTPRERRNMGDYFYAKARDILMDQFDFPEKRLENAMSINLLIQYMNVTLKYVEGRQLMSMAFQILLDLRNEYPEFRVPVDLDVVDVEDTPYSKHYNYDVNQEPITDVEKALFTRHIKLAAITSSQLDYVVSNSTDMSRFHFPTWKYLADEPENTKKFVRSHNWIINLYNHKFVKNFMQSIHRVQLGKTCALSFESILVMEEVIKEYTKAVPAEFRLCDDLNSAKMCYYAIENTTDSVLLVNFVQFHILQMSVYSSLLQPKALSNQGQQLLSSIQEHSLEKALKSAQFILCGIRRLANAETTLCIYLISATEYLFHVLDVLVMLSLSPNKQIAKEAEVLMKCCLDELDLVGRVQGYQPLQSDISTKKTRKVKMKDCRLDVEYYDQFPHPWFAMVSDASHYFTSR